MLVLTLLASPEALAQKGERLGPDGKRVVSSSSALVAGQDYVPGVLLVMFEEGAVDQRQLETNAQEFALGVLVSNDLATGLRRTGASSATRVLRNLRPRHDQGSVRSAPISGADGASEAGRFGGLQRLLRIHFDSDLTIEQLAEAVAALKGVEYAEPDLLMYPHEVSPLAPPFVGDGAQTSMGALSVPNDPLYSQQLSLESPSDRDIDVERAWAITRGTYSPPGKTCIVDSGIDYHNVDLGGGAYGNAGNKVRGGYDWYDNDSNPDDEYNDPEFLIRGHGTKVAGIVGAIRDNAQGVAGIAGGGGSDGVGVQLFALKVGGRSGGYPTAASIDALVEGSASEADYGYGCKVLNYSAGGPHYNESFRRAVNTVARNGAVLVASKGNNDATNSLPPTTLEYPADYDGSWVIAVGATDRDDVIARFSFYGNGIDLVAPGTSDIIYTTAQVEEQSFSRFDGTSASAPHVAGAAALLFSARSDLHPEEVQAILRATADNVPAMGGADYTTVYGDGRLNAGAAVETLRSPYTLTRQTSTGGSTVSTTGLYTATLTGSGSITPGTYRVKRSQVEKTVTFSTGYSANPIVACRGTNATVGWSAANPNYQTGYCEVVSRSRTSAVLRTYVYEVFPLNSNQSLGHYPSTASGVRFAYTAIGVPDNALRASLSGPTLLNGFGNATYTATATGGSGSSYTFKWYHRPPGASAFSLKATRTKTTSTDAYTQYLGTSGFHAVRAEITRGTATATADLTTQVEAVPGCGGGTPCLVGNEADVVAANLAAGQALPATFDVRPPRPNPARSAVAVEFDLPEGRDVTVVVYDVVGREVARPTDGWVEAGSHAARFEASGLPSGTYIVRVTAGSDVRTQRVSVVR